MKTIGYKELLQRGKTATPSVKQFHEPINKNTMRKATFFVSTFEEPELTNFQIEAKEHEKYGEYFDGMNEMFESDFFKHESIYVCHSLSDDETKLVDVYMTDNEGDLQMYLEHCMEVSAIDRYITIYEGADILKAVEDIGELASLNL